MKLVALISFSLLMMGCGQGFKAQGVSAKSSGLPEDGTGGPGTVQAPLVGLTQANRLNADLTVTMSALFQSFGSINAINISNPSQALNSTETEACALGGSISATAAGTLALSVNASAGSGSVANGSGTITFNSCVIDSGITVSGTVAVTAVNSNFVAAFNFQDNNTYSVSGSSQIIGNLAVTSGPVQQSCALALSSSVTVDGTFHLLSDTSSNTINASLTGTACGLAVNQNLSQAF